MHLGIMLYT